MSINKTIEGDIAGAVANYALIVSRFNSYIVDSLEAGAIDALQRHGVTDSNITVIKVPGALEIPQTVKKVIDKGSFDAIIALGAVIRGSTYHFEVVSNESARGLMDLSLQQNIPIINGILTVDSIEQALERAGTKAGNKGADAALVAMEMVSLMRRLESGS